MADSTVVANLPVDMDLYGCYDDGSYNNVTACRLRFPTKPVLVFTVFAEDNFGDYLDVESGDSTPEKAPGWITRRRAAGHPGPGVYCSLDLQSAVIQQFQIQRVLQPNWIIADYGTGPTWIPGTMGHQYEDYQNLYDLSVVADYIPGVDPPPVPPQGEDVTITSQIDGTQRHVWVVNPTGTVWHWWQDTAAPPVGGKVAWNVETLPPAP